MLDVVDTSFDFFYIGIHMYYAGYRISFWISWGYEKADTGLQTGFLDCTVEKARTLSFFV